MAFGLDQGPLHADEDFQYLEQAHRLVYGTGLIPWEYMVGIRSWLLPGALAAIFEVARLFGDDPRLALWGVAIALSLLSLPAILCAMLWGFRAAGWSGAVAAGLLNAAWYELAFSVPHALADSVGASLLIPGLYLSGLGRPAPPPRQVAAGGLLLGLTLAVRLQLAPVVILMLLISEWRRAWRLLVPAIALPILLAGLLDAATWTYPFQSVWLYLWINLAAGIADSFGTAPWYAYVVNQWVYWSVAAIPLTVLLLVGAWRKPILLAAAAAIVIPFALLSHKEDRFILPALPLFLTLAGIGSAWVADRYLAPLAGGRAKVWTALAVAVFWLGLAGLSVAHADYWFLLNSRDDLNAAEALINDDPGTCGVAIYPDHPWEGMPGYARLKPGVAIYGFGPDAPARQTAAFNYVIVANDPADNLARHGFTRRDCWDMPVTPDQSAAPRPRLCLWHRPGPCDPAAAPVFVAPFPIERLKGAGAALFQVRRSFPGMFSDAAPR